MFNNRQLQAYLALTGMAFFFAFNHIIGRAVHQEIPPLGLSFWRWLASALILLPFILPRCKQLLPVYRSALPEITLLGALLVGSTTLMLVALNFSTAINVSIINSTQPLLTVLFAWFFLKQVLSFNSVAGVFIGLLGVALTITRGDPGEILAVGLNTGEWITLVAVCGFAGYALNLYRMPATLGLVDGLFAIIIMGVVVLLPFYIVETLLYIAVPLSTQTLVSVFAMALLAAVFGSILWNSGNMVIGPNRASVFINLIPVFGAVMAVFFLNEQLYLYHFIGAVMVFVGVWLVAIKGQRAAEATAKE